MDSGKGTGISQVKVRRRTLPQEVRDESQIGPGAPTSPEPLTSQELILLNASLPRWRFPERKSPDGKHSQQVFPFVQLDV